VPDDPLRLATRDEVPLLVTLMEEMYAELGTPMDRHDAERGFAELLGDPRLGRVFLIVDGAAVAGYVVFTLGFTLQFGGRDGFIDDLFIRPAFRDRGFGAATLRAIRAEADAMRLRAVHLLVATTNPRAEALYRRAGFDVLPYRFMSLALPPSA
jgi:ribosomal protein S18 acetylase RimI-like enzyme